MNRRAILARAGLVTALAFLAVGCKETTPDKASFVGLEPIKVLATQIVASGDSSTSIAAGQVTYIIAKIEIANHTPTDWTPDLSKVYLMTQNQDRLAGVTAGSSTLVGISNPFGPIKKDGTQTYTVGFRANSSQVTGTIGYDY